MRERVKRENQKIWFRVCNIKWLDDDGWISHATTTTTTIILNPFQIGADEKRKKKGSNLNSPLERSREKMLIVGICGAASRKSDARSNVRDHLTPVHRLARRYHYDGDWNLTTWSKCVRERKKECGTNSVQTSHTPRHFSTSRQLLLVPRWMGAAQTFFSHVSPIVKHNPGERGGGGGLVRDIFQVVSCCWHVYTHAVCSLTL